ncbi:divalent metal cation transporter MntH [Ceratobasidium sp. AG-Ba]|nr:divalent metal cation transporter MntH [Ceratobasidium sp. AG-Ba]QRW14911.1 divalent metal cation transporter MntH [Ceratobasidium sp. AG-Ba]
MSSSIRDVSSPLGSPQRPENDSADAKDEKQEENAVPPNPSRLQRFKIWSKTSKDFIVVHVTRHVGPGVLASIAYFDPGNWSVDLQAGSQYGYKLLFVVLLAGLGAILLQTMAARLGCVTGLDLAQHCRLLLHSRPKHKLWFRRALLYPMYIVCEIGIIATDLAELLGSAIGLCLLIPAIPLWAGVLITSVDVIFVLAMAPTTSGRPVRAFELLLMSLVLVVFVVFIILIKKIDPVWSDVFNGYLPSKTLFQPGALYTSIGILGATVMPHALFLGSSLATLNRVSDPAVHPALPFHEQKRKFTFWQQFGRARRALFWVQRSVPSDSSVGRDEATRARSDVSIHELTGAPQPTTRHAPSSPQVTRVAAVGSAEAGGEKVPQIQPQAEGYHGHRNNSLEFIRVHLGHAIVDIVMSLLGFAVSINSAILILGAAAFYYGGDTQSLDAGLFDAHDLIRDRIGRPAAFLFALALLCSGQSASITATLAGQIVSEGFVEWQISPLARRTITRLIGLVPSMAVAIGVGRQGIDTLLVASQVALSIVLPFVIFPLVYLASSEVVMRVPKPEGGYVSYKNSWLTTSLGYLIFIVVVVANSYVLVSLAMGKDD